MRFATFVLIVALAAAARAQNPAQSASVAEPKSVTVPMTVDHNRAIIDVDLRLSNGTTQRVRAWLDNGNPDLVLPQRLPAGRVSCEGQLCSTAPPVEMNIGGMTITLGGPIPGAGMNEARVVAADHAPIARGMSPEINLPSTVLRNYDVLIDFPGHEFTIGLPGSLKFNGVKAKVIVNAQNGLIQIPSQIENKKYNLGLDVGSSISFLSTELFDKLSAAHPDWPHMIGAVGPANTRGDTDEIKQKLMRVDRVRYGPLFLTGVPVAIFSREATNFFERRAGVSTAGLIGTEALLNYRIGLDYSHSVVYFDIGRTFKFPDFDVIGLILGPDDDRTKIDGTSNDPTKNDRPRDAAGFTILGVADFDGKPSVPEAQAGDRLVSVDGTPVPGSTMGQVWLMLGGAPGQQRILTIERNGKQFTVAAQVQHFLGEAPDNDESGGKSKRK